MTPEQAYRYALSDADTESPENLQAAAAIYDRIARQGNPTLVQDDIQGTPLPNGLLRWFGFDFDRVGLPDEPLLPKEERPRWTGPIPGFTYTMGVADAKITVTVDEFQPDPDCEGTETEGVLPKEYRVTARAQGLDDRRGMTFRTWREVQEFCRRLESQLDESYLERHHGCRDDQDNLTGDSCSHCELG